MSISELQTTVNQKITDIQVGAITPEKLREAFDVVIDYLGSVADGLAQTNMATQQNLTGLQQTLSNLSGAFDTLNTFVQTPQQAITNLSETPPALSLSLGAMTLLGSGQVETNKKVNLILAALRAKKVISSS